MENYKINITFCTYYLIMLDYVVICPMSICQWIHFRRSITKISFHSLSCNSLKLRTC